MNLFYRALLGLSVLVIPVAAVAFPGMLPWGNEADTPRAEREVAPKLAALGSDTTDNPFERRSDVTGTSGPRPTEDTIAEVTTTTAVETTTTAAQPTTSDQGPATTTTAAPTATGGTITGDACPCTVTGTATLQGTVNLKGDLMVNGGTLVARPGVTVNGNGYQIMFMNGGKADFQGTKVSTWSGNGSNANLTRDITFDNLRRIMFHKASGKSTLKYFTVSNSGNGGVLGDYPVHFHLNGDSTRGTIVEGVVVVNGKNHAFVPHGSHGITFKNTIAWNINDSAYWWDPPGTNNCSGRKKTCTADNSNDTVFDHALAAKVNPGQGSDGHRVAGFTLGAGSGNVVKNSAALDVRGGKDCAGYQWPEAANQNAGGSVWTFTNNRSSSPDCHGIFVWQNTERDHVITGFNGDGVDHGAYSNSYTYRNIDVSYMEAIALGYSVHDSSIGTVTTGRHNKIAEGNSILFENVSIGTFIVNNGTGDIAGTYYLNNTGLSCGDIQYQSVKAGTRVVIDGSDC